MLTKEQHKYIEEVIQIEIDRLNKYYQRLIPKKGDAAQVVKSILQSILNINSPEQLNNILDIYPQTKESITLLAKLRFKDTAFEALNSKRLFTARDNIEQRKLGPEIAAIANRALCGWLSFQNTHIASAELWDDLRAETDFYQKENDHLDVKMSKLNKQIEVHKETLVELEEKNKKSSHKLNLLMGIISETDRQEWITSSPFSSQLKIVQETIKRLDSILVWKGRSKAAKIKIAFNKAIDAGLQGKNFKSFDEFKYYKKYSSSFYSQTAELSLDDTLSVHRFETIDKVCGITTPKSKL